MATENDKGKRGNQISLDPKFFKMKYIALLRGINVSGQKIIKMAELRVHLSELKINNVATYIQSGNILFDSDNVDTSILEASIQSKISEKYGFEVPVVVINRDYLIKAESENPFPNQTKEAANRAFITFLKEEPKDENIEALKRIDISPDLMELKGKNLYFYCPNGAGRSKISNTLFEKKLKVAATSRNFKTVWKLLELSLPE